jgi:hypothetical protein
MATNHTMHAYEERKQLEAPELKSQYHHKNKKKERKSDQAVITELLTTHIVKH